ncbi:MULTISPECIES: hypothetical protein [Halomonas]|uniref:hypothetical protein n=1 Tax=Halomonas TaxID=2745 RepID=UPI001C955D54|nr:MULTISPECIES: hypothetical protein [Halomonas]MBY6229219.1 hypothetical protein [Halomonas sp. DP3Y7-1]MCA0917718.1 hypothetical protein [Halomonas denitrificans]
MISRDSLTRVFERMSPESQKAAQSEAAARRMSVEDVVLEACLNDVQGQLYALRRRVPELMVMEGGRA